MDDINRINSLDWNNFVGFPKNANSIKAFKKLNGGKDLRLSEITVTLLKDFHIELLARGNSKNGISCYLRAVRAVYNSAIKEDQFTTKKNPFEHFKVPTTRRTKKRPL